MKLLERLRAPLEENEPWPPMPKREVVQQRLDAKVEFLLRILDDPAVEQLTDLDEEPSTYAGMDQSDLDALFAYFRGDAST